MEKRHTDYVSQDNKRKSHVLLGPAGWSDFNALGGKTKRKLCVIFPSGGEGGGDVEGEEGY